MAGYLDQYGAGDERREKIVKTAALGLLAILIVGGALYFFLKNYRQERQAKQFLGWLAKKDYPAAYRMWGCSEVQPCRDYPFDKFMEDWGPKSARGDPGAFRLTKSRSCGSGVILTISLGGGQEEKLWVEKSDATIGFSPWPGCPPGQ